ncbi:cobalamin-dependent protein [Myxococcota bacterium]|nr:cobalamin-dependent protein [Myxococcota bacterium]MBU1381669.1 cobalamin-dependent protein [Myxococcota bacterium]MBU1496512.1 cobalamin-dependent protein [Myxococcota bacterium]
MDLNLKEIKPYGDTLGDGAVQLSFTLPLKCGAHSTEAARRLVLSMGFSEAEVVNNVDIGEGFTFFVVYGKGCRSIDVTTIEVAQVKTSVWSRAECNTKAPEMFDRKLIVVGACIGEDAHTVGIDAIMNMKGFNGHYGLERYSGFESHNLGAQVTPENLLEKAIALKADAVLVSQVVTQRDIHMKNLTQFVEMVEASGKRNEMLLIAGGPRIDNALALELGYDAGFGRGSYAEDVASYILQELYRRKTSALA